ncbi:MAG: ATP-dependent sacrificial sulfur transferase LarE [Gemmatimonadaceae bacterium]|nr:ATP-dependent sacrificial sulfur transferase LarE [Gemmatimonadaceae bacterium]
MSGPILIDGAPVEADPRGPQAKLADLEELLRPMGRVLIGYSGGVDSALLVVATHRVLGADAIAVTADSESYAEGELELAAEVLRPFGIRHEVVRTGELDNPDYAANPVNRCYYCKSELFSHMTALAAELQVDNLLFGHNADDRGDYRPGATAAREFGVRAPLQEAGLTKRDVRELARRMGIPVWDRPALACLSSRFPYGTPVTREGLRRVDAAENRVRAEGFGSDVRVRHHDDVARIELPADDLARLLSDRSVRDRLRAALVDLGYARVTADLRGFRSGSLNEVLRSPGGDGEPAAAVRREASGLGLDPCECGEQGQILWMRLSEEAGDRLAQDSLRTALVSAGERAGARYIALDLTPAS